MIKHKYSVGQKVKIRIYDWNSEKIMNKIVDGVIIAQINEPFGYDVKLDEKVTFQGQIPYCTSKHFRCINHDNVTVDTLFTREFTIQATEQSLRLKFLEMLGKLIFRRINAVYVKPDNEIEYINYYAPNGEIKTLHDDKKYKDTKRLAYKVNHFFGFTKNTSEYETTTHSELQNTPIHFSANRCITPDFWEGLIWESISKKDVKPENFFKPEKDMLICGIASQLKDNKPPSFDKWFICSEQFMFLCRLICENRKKHKEQNVEKLIIPENKENYYIAHEHPISRYLYAAIYKILVLEDYDLPEHWKLPEKFIDGKQLTFDKWWPSCLEKCKP